MFWGFHRKRLGTGRKEFYAKQVSVADFTLKASIDPNLWQMYEATSRIENRTPTELFFSNLRTEIEGLRDEEDSRGNIKIALIELENWTSETVN